MTNTLTLDTRATVNQTIALANAGCELVRIATPGIRDAENLMAIKKELARQGCNVPLIADVHFQPKVAEVAAHIVDKVRINPGNYADSNKRKKVNYSEAEYLGELEKIAARLYPLLDICKHEGTAIRIGTNHGSMSNRIVSRFGNTPAGMVESALEFARICHAYGFQDLILSMKASNIRITVQANRLLAARMLQEGMRYPIHLGVTEAGADIEGRVKSAAGIGALLEDGIGDTVRVSLTGDPVQEIPFANQLVKPYNESGRSFFRSGGSEFPAHAFNYSARNSIAYKKMGDNNPAIVVGSGNVSKHDIKPDYIGNGNLLSNVESGEEILVRVIDDSDNLPGPADESIPVVTVSNNYHSVPMFRHVFQSLNVKKNNSPVILKKNYGHLSYNDLLIRSSIDFAALLVDGLGDGIWIESQTVSDERILELAFAILQATGSRITKTEYISCPSCARTQFDIEKVLLDVRAGTSHLKGLKIAVMGCIVNGPGEMADADYGYVGAGPGKVSIYKKQNLVQKNIESNHALDVLIGLMKASGDWRDPE